MMKLNRPLTVHELAWLLLAVMAGRPIDALVNQLRNFTKKGLFGDLPRLGDHRTAPYGYDIGDIGKALIFVWLAETWGMDAVRMEAVSAILARNLDVDDLAAHAGREDAVSVVMKRIEGGDRDFFVLLHADATRRVVAGRIARFADLAATESRDFWEMAPPVVIPLGAFAAGLFPLSDHIDFDRPAWTGGDK